MLKVELAHVIRHKVLVEKRPIRAVAREMGLHRDTVRNYVRGGAPSGKRKPAEREHPLRDAVAARVEAIVDDAAGKTTEKQRLTAKRIQSILNDGEDKKDAIDVGYTLVKEIFREINRRRAEVFIPLAYRPGDLAEVDFFEVHVDVDGKRRKAFMFVMRLMYSGRDFCHLYPRQDATCFLDGHVRAFAHFGAVPDRIVYDNLKAAVLKHLVGSERELTLRFMALSTHYVFEACFARPRTGHDKGGVEARGKGIRLAHLVPIPAGPSLLAISADVLARVDKDGDAERFAEELRCMEVPPAIGYRAVKTTEAVAISPRALVKVDGAVYSVPCHHARLTATVHAGAFDVELVCPDGERVVHARQPSNGRSVRYHHYLRELRKKPQAVRQVAHLIVDELGAPYVALWVELCESHGEKDAARRLARVLGAIDDDGIDVVTERLSDAKSRGRLLSPEPPPSPPPSTMPVPASLAAHEVERSRVDIYDELIDPGARPPAPSTPEPVAVDAASGSWGDADGDGLDAHRAQAGVLQ